MANWIAFTRAHCAIYRSTRGLIGGSLMGIQMLLLTTRGRKSGLARTLRVAIEGVQHRLCAGRGAGSEDEGRSSGRVRRGASEIGQGCQPVVTAEGFQD